MAEPAVQGLQETLGVGCLVSTEIDHEIPAVTSRCFGLQLVERPTPITAEVEHVR